MDLDYPPLIKSQGASLPWGGVYDINLNWIHPHCTHRDGNNLDISLSSFKNYSANDRADFLEDLKEAIEDSGFDFGKNEGPNDITNHWHILPRQG